MITDDVLQALIELADDRGYVRTTLDELALMAGLSRSTVRRHLDKLEGLGWIRRKLKTGRSGGVLIRVEKVSENVSENVSNVSKHAMSFELGSGSAKQNQEPEPNSASPKTCQTVHLPPALSEDERKRGAAFFRELRLDMNARQSPISPSPSLRALEPLPKELDA
jgi:DNA-binding MarR family transcriptional regulator